jgi:hypothetical protein
MARRHQSGSKKAKKASKLLVKRDSRTGQFLDMSDVKIVYPSNNYPTSVSDKDIKIAVRDFYATHFRKSAR